MRARLSRARCGDWYQYDDPCLDQEDKTVQKKLIVVLLAAFVAFWIYTQPASAADTMTGAAGGIWDGTQQVFTSAIDFIGELG